MTWFLLGWLLGGAMGLFIMALLTGIRERRYWEGKMKGGTDA
jgi:hypothetical protein